MISEEVLALATLDGKDLIDAPPDGDIPSEEAEEGTD